MIKKMCQELLQNSLFELDGVEIFHDIALPETAHFVYRLGRI